MIIWTKEKKEKWLTEIFFEYGENIAERVLSILPSFYKYEGQIYTACVSPVLALLGLEPSEDDVERLKRSLDPKGTGYFSLDDSKPLFDYVSENVFTVEDIVKSFSVLDQDGDGVATLEDLIRVYGEEESAEELKAMLQAADLNGDGKLSLEEYRILMNC